MPRSIGLSDHHVSFFRFRVTHRMHSTRQRPFDIRHSFDHNMQRKKNIYIYNYVHTHTRTYIYVCVCLFPVLLFLRVEPHGNSEKEYLSVLLGTRTVSLSLGTAESFCVRDRGSAEIAATRDHHENRTSENKSRRTRVGEHERERERARARTSPRKKDVTCGALRAAQIRLRPGFFFLFPLIGADFAIPTVDT